MRGVQFTAYGGPEVLTVADLPRPAPGPGELLIEVHAAGVTAPALRMLSGGTPLPCAPGGDVAGVVAAVGEGVRRFAVGDRVAAVAFTGAYAEFAVVGAALSTPLPDDVRAVDAVAVVRNGQVAYGALRAGEITAGQAVAVTAAAGGVGHLAVQLARILGAAEVIGAVSTTGKAEFVRGLGAADVLEYPAFGATECADLVVDGVGGDVLTRSVAALRPFGTVVSYSALDGTVDVTPLRMGMRAVRGFAMAPFVRRFPDEYVTRHGALWQWLRSAALRPATTCFPLTEVVAAHRLLADRTNLGKVVLVPS